MDFTNEKCVMLIDDSLPLGLIANTAAIMGITLGQKMPEVVGVDVANRSGRTHLGIIEFPIPILKAPPERIKAIAKHSTKTSLLTSRSWTFPTSHRAARPIQNSSKRWRRQMKLRSPTSASPSAAIKRR